MKVNGTRFRIGSMVFVMTGRDLQKVRANIISHGSGIIYSQQGDIVKVSTTNEGKVVDKVAQRLITQNSKDKLYYIIVPEETAEAATASPIAEQELLV
jgi:transcriptional accessory protein Tex/SPT6